MTRRKLCVLCMDQMVLEGRVACRQCIAVYQRTPSALVTQVMARRVRLFERRRQSAELKYLRVRVRELGKQTSSARTVTLAGKAVRK